MAFYEFLICTCTLHHISTALNSKCSPNWRTQSRTQSIISPGAQSVNHVCHVIVCIVVNFLLTNHSTKLTQIDRCLLSRQRFTIKCSPAFVSFAVRSFAFLDRSHCELSRVDVVTRWTTTALWIFNRGVRAAYCKRLWLHRVYIRWFVKILKHTHTHRTHIHNNLKRKFQVDRMLVLLLIFHFGYPLVIADKKQ